MSDLEDQLARYRKAILDKDRAAQLRLLNTYRTAMDRLAPLIELVQFDLANMDEPSPAKLFQLERYHILERQIREEMDRLAQETGTLVRGGQADVIQLGFDAARDIAAASAEDPAVIAGSFAGVPRDAVLDLVGMLEPDSPTGQLLASFGAVATKAIRDALTSGVILGKNPRVVAQAVRHATGMQASRALLISRTEMLRSYRTAKLARYAANADILDGWKWVSAKQRRTCAACLAMDGETFPLSQTFFPAHPACRCTARPVLNDKYAAKRAPLETGDQWLRRQDADTQDAILGKQGGQAFRDGEVELGDFVRTDKDPKWGESKRDGGIAWARKQAERRARKEAMRQQPTPVRSDAGFVPAKTITEAKRKAKELGLNLIGATPEQLPTVNLINEAADTLSRLGHTVEAPIKIVAGTHKSAGALYDVRIGKRGQIQIFTKTTFFEDPVGIAASAGKNGIFAWSDAAGIIRHEMAHYLHGKKKRYNLIAVPLTPDQRDMATVKVSRYAGTVSTEFVAEVFAAGSAGRVFDDEVMDLYRKLGGPEF